MSRVAPSEEDIVALIPRLRAYAMGLTRNRQVADDLVQDALERAWRNRGSYSADFSLSAWMFRILRNRWIDGYRVARHTVEDVDGQHAAELVTLPNQHWHMQYAELLRAIDGLEPTLREAFYLVMISGLPHVEAAAVLDAPLGTLKSWIRRGREDLLAIVEIEGASL